MIKIKKVLSTVLVMLVALLTLFSYVPAQAARKPTVVPQVQFANAPVTEYKVGDRVGFNIFSPNYGGRVEYRVVLWNDSQKSYSDLWNASNGYPSRYYTKWQPYGNNIFTLGWIINEPGSYRITVYAKRVGIPNSQGALKGYNCDSFMESVAFRVKPRTAAIESLLPVADVTVNQYAIPTLPSTVKAKMNDGTEKNLAVTWGLVDTTKTGTFIIPGTVEGTTLKASLRLIVNPVQTTLNVNNVAAGSINTVNVNLVNSIGFTPDLSKFSLSGYVNGYGVSNIRIYTLYMSTDRKTIQLSTDTLTLGSWYTLKVDGRDFTFQVPYNIGSGNSGYQVSLTARNMTVDIGSPMYPDITVYPSDAALSFTSYNTSIARYNSYTGKIEGVSPGTTTFSITASKAGYTNNYATFSVTVRGYSSYLKAEPAVLNEAAANDGSLVSGEIIVTSLSEYFRNDINTNNVLLTNLPQGFTYSVQRTSSTTLRINILGKANNHSNAYDASIHVTVYNGLYSGTDYLISNDIMINFIDAPAPAAPTFTISPTTVTNGNVTVTVIYPDGATEKKYRIGETGGYLIYTEPFTVTQNTKVYAHYKNSSGVQSIVGSYEVTNIDKTIPQDPVITINPTAPTNTAVAVTITYPSDATVRQYRIGTEDYQNYTAAFSITNNYTIIYARCQNAAGNWSNEVEYKIENIDKIRPPKPKLTPDTLLPAKKVIVTIDEWGDAVIKKYRIGNGDWLGYTEPVRMNENGTIEAQGTDAAGNMSQIGSLVVTNIDKTAPVAPTISVSTDALTNQDVIVTITKPADADSAEFKIDGGAWSKYSNPIVFTKNGSIQARALDAAGNISLVATKSINNIDKDKPSTPELVPSTMEPTNNDVTVTITNWGDAIFKKYRINNGGWIDNLPVITLGSNGKIEAQGEDAAGNLSDIGVLEVNNIDKTPPQVEWAKFTSPTTLVIKFDEKVTAAAECFKSGQFIYRIILNGSTITGEGNFSITDISGIGTDILTLTVSENNAIGDITGSSSGRLTITSGVEDMVGNKLTEVRITITKGSF